MALAHGDSELQAGMNIAARHEGEPLEGGVQAQPRGGPAVMRIVVGARLRRLREGSGITREVAGAAIRASHAKISRLELGQVGFKERDVVDLLTLYGVTDEAEREAFLELTRQANVPGWWHKYGDVLPSWFEMYVGVEQAVSAISSYEVQFVPGLLQTEAYARAVTLLHHLNEPAGQIDRRIQLRMTRQEILTGPKAPTLQVMLDETALRRPLGGRSAMREQLRYLIELTELPNITLRVLPFSIGGHAAAGGPFSILRFSEPDVPDIVYLEQLTSALYLGKRTDVDCYWAVMERLCVEAEPLAESTRFLQTIIEET